MQKIYIVLTHTGSLLSTIIKCYTKYEFSHVSIALDLELEEMYSFGRLKAYNPLIGGFVHEHINKGTFKRFRNTKAKVYCLNITDEQSKIICNKITSMKNEYTKYKFNMLGLLAIGFNKKIKIKNSFYCAEFIKYLIEEAGMEIQLPELVKPEDFNKLTDVEEIYCGPLKEYKYKNTQGKVISTRDIIFKKLMKLLPQI